MTSEEVMDLLRARWCAPSYAFLEQVANGTGAHKRRTVDAIAMDMWPSRGLKLHGFEVKVWRGDWLRELKTPAKVEEFAGHFHYFWLVAGPDVLQEGDPLFREVPPAWGVILAEPGKLSIPRTAPHYDTVKKPSWEFLAAILRAAGKSQVEPTESAGRAFKRGVRAASSTNALARLRKLATSARDVARDIDRTISLAERNLPGDDADPIQNEGG